VFEPIPFQIQGIPTLTLYERIAHFEIMREFFPVTHPALFGLVYALPVAEAISDGPVESGPAISGMVVVAPFDEAISDGPLDAAPVLSAVHFVLPVQENFTENELDGAPGLVSMIALFPVSRSVAEPDSINSGPVIAAMNVI
jgi:hypothetical protein